MVERYEICTVEELPPGERKIIEVEGLPHSIGAFNVDGNYYALSNVCPHQLAPLCEGRITGETVSDEVGEFEIIRDGKVIQCPWHGWKFNLTDGASVFTPHQLRTRTYKLTREPKSDDSVNLKNSAHNEISQVEQCGTELLGDEPPVETYPVKVEKDIVVLYV